MGAIAGAGLLVALGSGTLLTMHAANDVSSVSQTAAPHAASVASQRLTATSASGTKKNYTVNYQNQKGTSAATFKAQTVTSSHTASSAVDYVSGQTDGATMKLNHQTTAVAQGTMGHTYVHWTTGNWSVTAVTSNADASGTPRAFAKQVNTQLKQAKLPQAATTGAVTVYSQDENAKANTVKWQEGKQVYTVNGQTAAATMKLAQASH